MLCPCEWIVDHCVAFYVPFFRPNSLLSITSLVFATSSLWLIV